MSNKKPRRRTIRTDHAREAFLTELRATCNVSHSARHAGFSRQAAYEWRQADEEFAKDWEDAEEEAADKLEKVAWERATGEDKSDRMLEILLKAHRPEKYVDRLRQEFTGKDGGPLEIVIRDMTKSDD